MNNSRPVRKLERRNGAVSINKREREGGRFHARCYIAFAAASSSVQHRCTSGRRSFGWLADCSMRFALLPLSPSLPSQLKSQLRRNTRERERGGGNCCARSVQYFPLWIFSVSVCTATLLLAASASAIFQILFLQPFSPAYAGGRRMKKKQREKYGKRYKVEKGFFFRAKQQKQRQRSLSLPFMGKVALLPLKKGAK